jgi:hypothetical protein
MKFADIPFHPARRTLRQFAAIWLVLFLALGLKHYFKEGHHTAGLVLGCVGLVIGVPGLLQPTLVRWVFVGAIVLTFPIGWFVSQLMLALLFYLLITPAALFFRLRGRDLLGRKRASDRSTFWAKKEMPQDVRSYFRQF